VVCLEQENLGAGAARNRAIEAATGTALAFLDADDIMTPSSISARVNAFQEDPTLDVVFGMMREFISPDLSTEDAAKFRAPHGPLRARLPHTALIRRGSFFKVGLFSEERSLGDMVDWSARMIEANLHARSIEYVVMERRLHRDNNNRRKQEDLTDYVRTLKQTLDRRRAG
jgi:glycosyltransferase involved in cell wall biosynthesis